MGKVDKIFRKFSDKFKLEIPLFGNFPENPNLYQQNKSLQNCTTTISYVNQKIW